METTKPSEYFTPIQYAPSRKDYFAAHALQGLLASGKFTQLDEDGEEQSLTYQTPYYDEDGNDTGKKKFTLAAIELAWHLADRMIRDED